MPSGLTADGVPAITYVRGFGSSALNEFIVMVAEPNAVLILR